MYIHPPFSAKLRQTKGACSNQAEKYRTTAKVLMSFLLQKVSARLISLSELTEIPSGFPLHTAQGSFKRKTKQSLGSSAQQRIRQDPCHTSLSRDFYFQANRCQKTDANRLQTNHTLCTNETQQLRRGSVRIPALATATILTEGC